MKRYQYTFQINRGFCCKKIGFIPKWYHFVDTTFVDSMLICETFHSQRMLNETSFSSVLNHILVQYISFCLIILPWCATYIRGSSGYSKKLPTETLITDKFIHLFVSCLLSHSSSFGSSSSSIYFLRKQHYMHPFNKLPVLCLNRLWRWTTSSVRFMEWWPFSVLNGSLLSSNIN